LGKSGHRWEDNVKIDLKEIGLEDIDWTYEVRVGTDGGLL
jgi:hypothetical protein